MATVCTYKCSKCNYTAEVSGKPDVRFAGKTETVVCNKCHELYDELTEPLEPFDTNTGCENCSSKKYKIWDYKNKPCPKCKDGKMEKDENGVIMMVD
jgi:hypothetical protein